MIGNRMSTPQRNLDTSFVRDKQGRIISTREAVPTHGPLFCLVRGASDCAWSIHADLPNDTARAINRLARSEPCTSGFHRPSAHTDGYRRLIGTYVSSRRRTAVDPLEHSGPAMTFPDALFPANDAVRVDDERLLAIEFRGWEVGEIASGRAPVLAVFADGHPVSLCFCARASDAAAEAGVETAERYRGRASRLCRARRRPGPAPMPQPFPIAAPFGRFAAGARSNGTLPASFHLRRGSRARSGPVSPDAEMASGATSGGIRSSSPPTISSSARLVRQ